MILIVEQVYIFLYAILAGALVAFFYDILRIKRRAFKTGVIIVSLEDIVYWLVASVILFIAVYNSNSGEMRGFIFIGNVIGVMLYESLLSKIIIDSSILIINAIKKLLKFMWKVISYPFKFLFKVISIPMKFIFRQLAQLFKLLGRILRRFFGKAGKLAGAAAGKTAGKSKLVGKKISLATSNKIKGLRRKKNADKKASKKKKRIPKNKVPEKQTS